MGQKFTWYLHSSTIACTDERGTTQLVFGSIAFKLFNLGQLFLVACHKLGEFWPIPPDRAGVTESGWLASLLAHAFSGLPTKFLWD